MTKDTCVHAFPAVGVINTANGRAGGAVFNEGMTLRQYAAIKAMQGMFAKHGYGDVDYVVKRAVKAADALLAELEK